MTKWLVAVAVAFAVNVCAVRVECAFGQGHWGGP